MVIMAFKKMHGDPYHPPTHIFTMLLTHPYKYRDIDQPTHKYRMIFTHPHLYTLGVIDPPSHRKTYGDIDSLTHTVHLQ